RQCTYSYLFKHQLRPPCSTLFPYTTLFRSRADRAQADDAERLAPQLHSHEAPGLPAPFARAHERGTDVPREGQDHGQRVKGARRDRKSTRLNSSHVAISYAVFCLKKKKQ